MISAKTHSDLNAALRRNDARHAAMIAEAAIARGEAHEMLFATAASARLASGDHHGAAAHYLRATQLSPHNPDLLSFAGDSLRHIGQLSEAIALFDRAIALAPAAVAAWYGRALAFEAEGALESARDSYMRVTQLAPTVAAGFSGLASILAQQGTVAEAKKHAEQARSLGPGEAATLLASARCEIADRRPQEAVAYLQALLQSPGLTAQDEIVANELLGNALDQLDMVDPAFEAYSRANERFAMLHLARNDRPIALQAIESVHDGISRLAAGALKPSASAQPIVAATHIFLLGYPRSGTTLTEQILLTMDGTVSLEETPTLAAAERYLNRDGISELAGLSEDKIMALRRAYWDVVARAGIDASGKTFVDMDPLKGSALPLISRLFPEAKIVLIHRDPRDVIWSCFRRNFVYSPATYEFTSLMRAARHYHAVMAVTQKCIETLPIKVHVVRYEDLVKDFDTTTNQLCAFLGLPWSPKLRDFNTSAGTRSVRTASSPQVRQALFDGAGQWLRYERHLAPVLSLLEPWIDSAALQNAGVNPQDA